MVVDSCVIRGGWRVYSVSMRVGWWPWIGVLSMGNSCAGCVCCSSPANEGMHNKLAEHGAHAGGR
jgi:hypothetical protein